MLACFERARIDMREAESESQLRQMLETLPFVQVGIVEVSVIQLRPYAGFGPERTSEDRSAVTA